MTVAGDAAVSDRIVLATATCPTPLNVLAAKQRLAEGHEELPASPRRPAARGARTLRRHLTDLRDEVIARSCSTRPWPTWARPGPTDCWPQIALVAHGGYGRRDVAPYSATSI